MGYDDEDSYGRGEGDVRYYTIEVNALESKVFKHTYLYGNELIMMNFIYHRLHSSTVLELRKFGPAERPANYD